MTKNHTHESKAAAADREKYPKVTSEFHKKFDASRSETVVTYFACSHRGKVLKPGKMFITQSYVAFHAQIFGKTHKKLVPFSEISDISKQHYGILPNSIKIVTTKKKELFFASFIHRDDAYDALMKQWYTIKPSSARMRGADNLEEGEEPETPPSSHHDNKKDVELKRVSLNTGSQPGTDANTKSNDYSNYDITKKSKSPTPAHGSGKAGRRFSTDPGSSLSDRAQALIDSGAIVTGDSHTPANRTSQAMIDFSSAESPTPTGSQKATDTSSTTTETPATTTTTDKAKRNRCCGWAW